MDEDHRDHPELEQETAPRKRARRIAYKLGSIGGVISELAYRRRRAVGGRICNTFSTSAASISRTTSVAVLINSTGLRPVRCLPMPAATANNAIAAWSSDRAVAKIAAQT